MARINGTTALILSGLAVVIVAAVGWFMLISPQRAKADKLSTQHAAVESELAADQQLLSSPSKAKTRAALAAGKRALPDDPQVSQILRQLAGFAAKSRTQLNSIAPGAASPVTGAQAIPISLSFTGRYFGLQELLRLLRQSASAKDGKISSTGRLYTVDSIAFTGGGENGLVAATIALNAFVYTPAPVVAPAATASSATAAAATP
jgi:Tfp pilus assembly protein PilO